MSGTLPDDENLNGPDGRGSGEPTGFGGCSREPVSFLDGAAAESWTELCRLTDRELLARWVRRRSAARTGLPPAVGSAARRAVSRGDGDESELALRCGDWWKQRLRRLGRPALELPTAVLWSADQPSQWSRSAWQLLQTWQRVASRARRTNARPAIHARAGRSARPSHPFRGLETTARQFADSLLSRPVEPLEVLLAASVAVDAVNVLSSPTLWRLGRVLLQWLLLQPRLPAGGRQPVGRSRRTASLRHGSDGDQGDNGWPVWSDLVARGELPLLASALWEDQTVPPASQLRAVRVLRRGLALLVSRDGAPLPDTLPALTRWAAPLVRSAAWSKWLQVELWDTESADRFRGFVRVTASLCLPDGHIALTSGAAHRTLSLLQTAARLAQLPPASLARRYVAGLANGSAAQSGRTRNGRSVGRLDKAAEAGSARTTRRSWPGVQSDDAKLACLRDAWSSGASTVVVAYDQPTLRLQVWAARRTLLHGDWTLSVRVDGRPVRIPSRWDCVCWHSDEDADYLELQLEADGLTLERQVLLARKVGLLLLADSVKLPQRSRLEYASSLPVAEGLSVVRSSETRERTLVRGRVRVARVFPLLLPDVWTESVAGKWEWENGRLVVTRTTEAQALYAPVVLDWEPRHRSGPVEWRGLTVSQDGKVVSPDAAAAFRLRVGNYQLVVYRSLQHDGSARAFLGHQTRYETVVGQFDCDGDVLPLLMVE